MNNLRHIYTFLFVCLAFTGTVHAQENASATKGNTAHFFNTDIDYSLYAHFSIGGTSPMGFPKEIRKIESYNPTLQLGLQAHATKWLSSSKNWGLRAGIAVEGKGMSTKAGVKNYLTEIIQDNSKVQGYFTGMVQTDVRNTYLSIPVSAVYKFSNRWNIYGGLFAAVAIDKQFDGYVSNGYLRQDTPVGAKISFEDESLAAYDFSEDLRTFEWGTQVGAEWKAKRNFIVFTDMTYGFNDIFNTHFSSIDFAMHNLYLNIGFGYKF